MSQNSLLSHEELKFWLQIMGDHARFIHGSLNGAQLDLLMVGGNFISIFDRFLTKVALVSEENQESFLNEVTGAVLSFRDFKRELLSTRLKNLTVTSLTPTFYNHMLNELEDFLKVLTVIAGNRSLPESIIGQHLLWSLDASGHATILGSDLDKVENEFRHKAKLFTKKFDRLYLKAVELAGYFRSNPVTVYPALKFFNSNVVILLNEFMVFLEELKVGVFEQKVLGRLSPLTPDHMWREECYYLIKGLKYIFKY